VTRISCKSVAELLETLRREGCHKQFVRRHVLNHKLVWTTASELFFKAAPFGPGHFLAGGFHLPPSIPIPRPHSQHFSPAFQAHLQWHRAVSSVVSRRIKTPTLSTIPRCHFMCGNSSTIDCKKHVAGRMRRGAFYATTRESVWVFGSARRCLAGIPKPG